MACVSSGGRAVWFQAMARCGGAFYAFSRQVYSLALYLPVPTSTKTTTEPRQLPARTTDSVCVESRSPAGSYGRGDRGERRQTCALPSPPHPSPRGGILRVVFPIRRLVTDWNESGSFIHCRSNGKDRLVGVKYAGDCVHTHNTSSSSSSSGSRLVVTRNFETSLGSRLASLACFFSVRRRERKGKTK